MSHAAKCVPDEILAALEAGPMHVNQISEATNRSYEQIAGPIRNLRYTQRIVVIGLCGEHGVTDRRKDAPIYALPGARKLKHAAPVPAARRMGKSSGVVALPREEREFRLLRRDFFGHMRLCEESRR